MKRFAILLIERVHPNDVVMGESCHPLGFLDEALGEGIIATQMRMQDLNRDRAVQPQVRPAIDDAHAAAGDFLVYSIFS